MNNRYIKAFVAGGFLVALAMAFAGCETCKPGKPVVIGRYGIEVSLDESLKSSAVIVDLVGVNGSDLSRWEAYDMTKYWNPQGDAMRHDANKKTLNFVSGKVLTQGLEITDPQWDKWKGMTHVMVLADLPGAHPSQPGNQDARRQTLLLDKCNWPKKTPVLKLMVHRSGIVIVTKTRGLR